MRWTLELGAGRNHSIILMPARKVHDFQTIRDLAEQAFAKVDVLPDAEDINGHPEGPNSMMRQAIWHMQTANLGPWTFLEPDCILLTSDALDTWDREYRAYGKPFMGELRPAHDVTPDYLTGNMVLPKDALLLAPMLARRGLSKDGVELAFDIVAAHQTLPQAHLTKLLQQVPKPRDGEGHHFPDQESLKIIRDGAVMFHPVKDGSLIERLRERKAGERGPTISNDQPKERGPIATAFNHVMEGQDALLARIADLEKRLAEKDAPKKTRGKPMKKRTPAQIAADKARMAKVREAKARKAVAA